MPLLVLPADVGVEVETPPLPVDEYDSAQSSGSGLTVFFEKTTSLQMQTQSDIPITAILLSDSPPADSPSRELLPAPAFKHVSCEPALTLVFAADLFLPRLSESSLESRKTIHFLFAPLGVLNHVSCSCVVHKAAMAFA